ncbi:hypothetical protein EVAR_46777_1 [Eumeta japonica]|uniref:Uncharacterized protein n=1 Tax=Eumeta variegata TaxID=151549 RepID=A0A4C1XBB5_EUMVA|nr:hypothetical protein EVAR_46777_1 [Eumeta japonica]
MKELTTCEVYGEGNKFDRSARCGSNAIIGKCIRPIRAGVPQGSTWSTAEPPRLCCTPLGEVRSCYTVSGPAQRHKKTPRQSFRLRATVRPLSLPYMRWGVTKPKVVDAAGAQSGQISNFKVTEALAADFLLDVKRSTCTGYKGVPQIVARYDTAAEDDICVSVKKIKRRGPIRGLEPRQSLQYGRELMFRAHVALMRKECTPPQLKYIQSYVLADTPSIKCS